MIFALGAMKKNADFIDTDFYTITFFALSIVWVGFFFFFNLLILFIYFWLRWVFVAAHGLSLVAASGGYSSLQCAGLLIAVASLVAEHGLYARGLQ